MRKKIKIILINILFNYSFDLCFGLKILNWYFKFFSFNLIPIIKRWTKRKIKPKYFYS